MSVFEKIIIPLIDNSIRLIDLTSAAGFIDSFTLDPDRPSGESELFLVYDDSKRNKYTIDRAIRFSKSTKIKRTYIKYVNNVPYLIYSFWVNPEVKKLYNGVLTLNTVQKSRILQFWGPFDSTVDTVLTNSVLTTDIGHTMPLEDYRDEPFDYDGLMIKTKGTASNDVAPFYFIFLIERSYRLVF